MRVLNVYRTYFPDPPGGLQEAIRQICLSTRGLDVVNTIYTLSPKPTPRELNYPEASVIRTRSWMSPASCDIGGVSAFSNFSDLAKSTDLLHYFSPWPFADILNHVVRPSKPSVKVTRTGFCMPSESTINNSKFAKPKTAVANMI